MVVYLLFQKNSSNNDIIKYGKDYKVNEFTDERTYFEIIQEFININANGTLIYNKKRFKKSKNPKISIVITVHNAEAFIKSAVRNVQNQDFQDIEMIIIEDYSKDASVKIIKELMKEDPRIVFLQNEGNRGYLYTMIKGVLNSKGKYILILDVDDFFSVENTFSIIYEEAEKNNLEMLRFGATQGILDMNTYKYTHTSFYHYYETSILTQPEISEKAYMKNGNGDIIQIKDVLWGNLIKSELFIRVVNEIDKKFLNIINNSCADNFLFFILTKRAKNYKNIKKLLYVAIQIKKSNSSLVTYFTEEKFMVRDQYHCRAFLNYIEFTFIKSDNDFTLSSFALQNFFLNSRCRHDKNIRNDAITICKLFLDNQNINNNLKDKIKVFLNETNEK